MNYTLNQLQIFLKVAETGSITKAAEELNLTQPAVSIQLKNFQDQFEIPLSEVVGRKLYITDFGKEIASAAQTIINELHAINLRASNYKEKLIGRLKLTIVSTGKYVMPYFLADFMKLHPAIELIMDVTNKQKVAQSIEHNEVDFALVSILPPNMQVEYIDLLKNKFFLVSNTPPPANTPANFSDKPFIFRENGSGTRQLMEKFLEENHIEIHKKIELTSNEAVKQAIIAGLGYSVMPLIGLKNELEKGELFILPIEQLPIITTWRLIWANGKKLSPVAAHFLSYLATEKDTIIQKNFGWHEHY